MRKKSFQGSSKEIVGKTVTGISRRAKLLVIEFSNNLILVIHLKLTGQIIISDIRNQISKSKYTRVIIIFSDNTQLFFNDLRVFGWMKIISKIKDKKPKTQSKNKKEQNIKNIDQILGIEFGPEPFNKEFTVGYLKKIFSKTKRAIKIVLMDQKKIAGIGNIYANEALFLAGIAPEKPAAELSRGNIKILKSSILKVLKGGIKYKGSSAADEMYIQPSGEKGKYQYHFRVYQRDGKKCRKCGTLIKRIKIGDRGTFFCHRCQK